MHKSVHTYTYISTYMRTYIHTYVLTYIGTYISTYVIHTFIYTHMHIYKYTYIYIHTYTGCPRRNIPDFGRVFLMLKYTDITQNTNIQIGTVMEIMAREKCRLLAGPRSVPVG